MDVKFEYYDLKRVIYWIICKFKEDEFHHEATSSKSDLIGGFFDRWFNRAPEFLIFTELLKEKEYDVVIDNFLYGQDTKKNSPDVIGLQDNKGNVVAVFTKFSNGEWFLLEDMPFIEVKTFKKKQALITIPESQMDDDHYYVIVESNVREDYLTSLFEDSLFEGDIFESMQINPEFILSDDNNQIINPEKLSKDHEIGFFRLIGIFKGSEIKKFAIKAISVDNKPQKPRYFFSVSEIDRTPHKINKNIPEGIYLHKTLDKNGEPENNVPFYIEFIDLESEVKLIKELKSYILVTVSGKIKINEYIMPSGYYKIEFKVFDRSSKKSEYIGNKYLFEAVAKDVTDDLIRRFDEIVNP